MGASAPPEGAHIVHEDLVTIQGGQFHALLLTSPSLSAL